MPDEAWAELDKTAVENEALFRRYHHYNTRLATLLNWILGGLVFFYPFTDSLHSMWLAVAVRFVYLFALMLTVNVRPEHMADVYLSVSEKWGLLHTDIITLQQGEFHFGAYKDFKLRSLALHRQNPPPSVVYEWFARRWVATQQADHQPNSTGLFDGNSLRQPRRARAHSVVTDSTVFENPSTEQPI